MSYFTARELGLRILAVGGGAYDFATSPDAGLSALPKNNPRSLIVFLFNSLPEARSFCEGIDWYQGDTRTLALGMTNLGIPGVIREVDDPELDERLDREDVDPDTDILVVDLGDQNWRIHSASEAGYWSQEENAWVVKARASSYTVARKIVTPLPLSQAGDAKWQREIFMPCDHKLPSSLRFAS